MQAIKTLKEAGFTVQAAADAVGCTEVLSSKLFYYYNPRFANSPAEVYARLQPASFRNGQYSLIIAGEYPGPDGEIPLAVVNAEMREEAARLEQEHENTRLAARTAERNFYDSIRQMMVP